MKNKQAKRAVNEVISLSHAEFISASSTHVVTRGQQQRQALKILNQVQNDGTYFNNDGFTLIELLVVVLIIGILAAVALPQYQKAVLKSRYASIKALTKNLANAMEIYYLENGSYTADQTLLDITANFQSCTGGASTVRVCQLGNGQEIQLSAGGYVEGALLDTNGNRIITYQVNGVNNSWAPDETICCSYSNTPKDLSHQVCSNETGKAMPASPSNPYCYRY